MTVLETRTDDDGFVHRRRRAKDGTTHWTIEVPASIWNQFNSQGRNRDRVAAMRRVEDRESKKQQAIALHGYKRSNRNIAMQLSVAESTVRRWLSAIVKPEN